jgi:hypothetical protein
MKVEHERTIPAVGGPGIAPAAPAPSGDAVLLIRSANQILQRAAHRLEPWQYRRVPRIGWYARCRHCGLEASLSAEWSRGYRIPAWLLSLPVGECHPVLEAPV